MHPDDVSMQETSKGLGRLSCIDKNISHTCIACYIYIYTYIYIVYIMLYIHFIYQSHNKSGATEGPGEIMGGGRSN